jgi:hypothetical protein
MANLHPRMGVGVAVNHIYGEFHGRDVWHTLSYMALHLGQDSLFGSDQYNGPIAWSVERFESSIGLVFPLIPLPCCPDSLQCFWNLFSHGRDKSEMGLKEGLEVF